MKKKIVGIIQARMGSERLPGKVLKKVGEKSILEILVNRLKRSKSLDEIVVATTIKKKDDVIVNLCRRMKVHWFRGSEEDVLRRYSETAKAFNADIVVRITADNPLTDPKLITKLIEKHLESKADYTYCSNAPLGVGSEIINFSALEKTDKNAKYQQEREHVTPYIKNHSNIFKIQNFESNLGNQNIRLTVDTKEDLKLMRVIHENLGKLEDIELEDILHFLEDNQELCRNK